MVNGGSIVGETGEYGESVTVTGISRICENAKMRKSGEDMGWARFRRRHFRIFAFSHIKMWWCIFRKRRSDAEKWHASASFSGVRVSKNGVLRDEILEGFRGGKSYIRYNIYIILFIIYSRVRVCCMRKCENAKKRKRGGVRSWGIVMRDWRHRGRRCACRSRAIPRSHTAAMAPASRMRARAGCASKNPPAAAMKRVRMSAGSIGRLRAGRGKTACRDSIPTKRRKPSGRERIAVGQGLLSDRDCGRERIAVG